MKTMRISDITLRSIAQSRTAAVSFKERIEIARTLDRLRMDVIELPAIADHRSDVLANKTIAGVVTSAAMIALTDWRVFLLVLLTFALVFIWKRIVSLTSVVSAATYPVYAFLLTFFLSFRRDGAPLWYLLFATAAALFVGLTVLIKHHANIGRLLRGEEKPVILGRKK